MQLVFKLYFRVIDVVTYVGGLVMEMESSYHYPSIHHVTGNLQQYVCV